MKKTYTKPIVLMENMALSQSASSGCFGIANSAEHMCSVFLTDILLNVFSSGIVGCEITGVGEDMVCYHNPTDDNNVFSS